MILGVDHVALSARDLSAPVAALIGEGYRVMFAETALPNDQTKARFLTEYHQLHSITYLQRAGETAIELTNYGAVQRTCGGYDIWFGGRPQGVIDARGNDHVAGAWRQLGCHDPCVCYWPAVNANIWFDGTGHNGAGIRAVLSQATDIDATLAFWSETFGLRAARASDGLHVVEIKAAVPQWALRVAFVPGTGQPTRLDDGGFACLALLTNDLASLIERVDRTAVDHTGVFTVRVNGRDLAVAILRAPGGELVELIQVVSR